MPDLIQPHAPASSPAAQAEGIQTGNLKIDSPQPTGLTSNTLPAGNGNLMSSPAQAGIGLANTLDVRNQSGVVPGKMDVTAAMDLFKNMGVDLSSKQDTKLGAEVGLQSGQNIAAVDFTQQIGQALEQREQSIKEALSAQVQQSDPLTKEQYKEALQTMAVSGFEVQNQNQCQG